MAKRPPARKPARRRARQTRRTTVQASNRALPFVPESHACPQSAGGEAGRKAKGAGLKSPCKTPLVRSGRDRQEDCTAGPPRRRAPARHDADAVPRAGDLVDSRRRRRRSISSAAPPPPAVGSGRDGAHPGRPHRVESGPDRRRCRCRLGRRLQLGRRSAWRRHADAGPGRGRRHRHRAWCGLCRR